MFSDVPVLELSRPIVDQNYYLKTGGKEDAKLVSGHFKCCCQYNNGRPCSTRYSAEQLLDIRMNHLQIKHDQLDLVVMAKLSMALPQKQFRQERATRVSVRKIAATTTKKGRKSVNLSSCTCMQFSKTGFMHC